MSSKVNPVWDVVIDDDFLYVEDAVEFLQSEFPSSGGSTGWSSVYLKWKLGKGNPAGCGFCTLARQKDKIIGIVTLARRKIWLGKSVVDAGEVGDCYVGAQFRRKGVFAKLHPSESNSKGYLNSFVFGRLATETRERAEGKGVKLIYGTPNQKALPGWTKRLGYRRVGALEPERYLRPSAMMLKKRIKLSAPFIPIIRFLDRFVAKAEGMFSSISIEPYKFDFEEVDNLWCRAREYLDFSVVRDASWIHYRYIQNPAADYVFWAVYLEGKLEALVVLRELKINEMIYVQLVDAIVDSPADKYITALIRAFSRQVIKSEADGFSLWHSGNDHDMRLLRLSGFKGQGVQPVIVYANQDINRQINLLDSVNFPIGFSDNG